MSEVKTTSVSRLTSAKTADICEKQEGMVLGYVISCKDGKIALAYENRIRWMSIEKFWEIMRGEE